MEKNKHLKRPQKVKRTLFCFFIIVLSGMVACVDDSYDLKNVSLDVGAGGEDFTIPFGHTDSIMLSDLIDESGVLTKDASGQYAITESGDTDPVDMQINPVLIEHTEVNLDSLELDFLSGVLNGMNLPSGMKVTLPELKAPVSQTGSYLMNTAVPDELISVRTVELNQERPAVCRFIIKFEGMPAGIGNITLNNFQVVMPDFLKFAESDQMENGVLSLSGVSFSPYQGFSREFTITGADFREMNNGEGVRMQQINGENRFILNSEVTMQGQLIIGQTTIDVGELDGIKLIPEITVATIEVEKFTGLVDPEIDPARESIAFNLDEDLDFLKEKDVTIGIHNPQIYVTVGNTVGVPVDLNVTMYAKDEQGALIDGSTVNNVKLKVNAAETDGVVTKTNFLISRQGSEKEGYEAVRVDNLSNLMKIVPDSVVFELTAKANLQQTHHIDLEKKMQVTASYDVNVPLQFDTLHINYKDTIDGLIDELSDVAEKITNSEMQLALTAESTIPVALNMEVTPLDSVRREIAEIRTEVIGTIAAGNGTEVTKTPIVIKLSLQGKRLSELDALALRITATSGSGNGGNVPLNARQFLQFTGISLKTTGGVELDLND
ncbi:MAG: hypothetical protein AB7V25_01595 [Mangrovibacterium sp.]